VLFAPNYPDAKSPEYHSYFFWWWIEGTKEFTAEQIQSDMLVNYRGLSEERGQQNGFSPDLAQVSSSYRSDPQGLKQFGGAVAKSFAGTVTIYDTHGKLITLNSEVVAAVCPGSNHTAFFFGLSLEPRSGPIWQQLDAARDSFRCSH